MKNKGKSEKEKEGPVGGPIPGFKGTKRSVGPAGAPVCKETGKVFKEGDWTFPKVKKTN